MKTLGEYILEHPLIEKEQLFLWIKQILSQLQAREQIGKIPDIITPFDILLRKNKTVLLTNQRESGRRKCFGIDKFIPRKEQNGSIYSFGKTLQFLFAKTELSPQMTKQEEAQFQKIISKCLTSKSKKKYQNFSEITVNFPPKKKKVYIRIILYLLAICVGVFLSPDRKLSRAEEQKSLELGISYFLLEEDYAKSETIFEQVESKQIAVVLKEMASYMAGNSSCTDLEMEITLNEAVKMLEVQQNWKYKASIIMTYEKVDTPNARKQIRQYVKDVVEESDCGLIKKKMREILANVYLREGEYKNAMREYRTLLVESDYQEICKTLEEIQKKTY